MNKSKKVCWVISLLVLSYVYVSAEKSAITYDYMGGRLGDNLLTYIKTKWLAHVHDLDFYYKPFQFSEWFALHSREKSINTLNRRRHQISLHSQKEESISFNSQAGYLYMGSLLCTPRAWNNDVDSFFIPDQQFVNHIKEMLMPTKPVAKIDVPQDYISVAVHVRKGSGFDLTDLAVIPHFITKFTPDAFFIQQIEQLAQEFFPQTLYVYLFTDHKDPQSVLDLYKKEITSSNVILDARLNGNYESVLIEDLFNMAWFDCLIRPAESSLSMVAQLIGNHKIVIYPSKVHKEGDFTVITRKTEIRSGVAAHVEYYLRDRFN